MRRTNRLKIFEHRNENKKKMNLLNDENNILLEILKLDDHNNLNKIILSYIHCLPNKYIKKVHSNKLDYCSSLQHFSSHVRCIICGCQSTIYFHLDQNNNFYNVKNNIQTQTQNENNYDYLVCIYCIFHILTADDDDFYNYNKKNDFKIDYDQLCIRLKPFAKFDYYFGHSEDRCKGWYQQHPNAYIINWKCSVVYKNTFNTNAYIHFKNITNNTLLDEYHDIEDKGRRKVRIKRYECSLCRRNTGCYTLIGANGYNHTKCKYYKPYWIIICDGCAPLNTTSIGITRHGYIENNADDIISSSNTSDGGNPSSNCFDHKVEPQLLFLYKFCIGKIAS